MNDRFGYIGRCVGGYPHIADCPTKKRSGFMASKDNTVKMPQPTRLEATGLCGVGFSCAFSPDATGPTILTGSHRAVERQLNPAP
jgi:hypothetical protein